MRTMGHAGDLQFFESLAAYSAVLTRKSSLRELHVEQIGVMYEALSSAAVLITWPPSTGLLVQPTVPQVPTV